MVCRTHKYANGGQVKCLSDGGKVGAKKKAPKNIGITPESKRKVGRSRGMTQLSWAQKRYNAEKKG